MTGANDFPVNNDENSAQNLILPMIQERCPIDQKFLKPGPF
jgi:hypothetical protein